MNYRSMSISNGSKYAGFWSYVFVEVILLITACTFIFTEEYAAGFIIFILLEVREINQKLEVSNDNLTRESHDRQKSIISK